MIETLNAGRQQDMFICPLCDQFSQLLYAACRFFFNKRDYLVETSFYENKAFRQCLPELAHASDNKDGRVVSRSGYRFPPFMVLDRGVTLKDWLKVKRNPSAVLAMIGEVLELLQQLHGSGYVHRDLKPENLLFVFHTQQWRLLDFGIAATSGVEPVELCMPYPCYLP
jgi:serine/threonine protein kinase